MLTPAQDRPQQVPPSLPEPRIHPKPGEASGHAAAREGGALPAGGKPQPLHRAMETQLLPTRNVLSVLWGQTSLLGPGELLGAPERKTLLVNRRSCTVGNIKIEKTTSACFYFK